MTLKAKIYCSQVYIMQNKKKMFGCSTKFDQSKLHNSEKNLSTAHIPIIL
jgi:hypothetical protein